MIYHRENTNLLATADVESTSDYYVICGSTKEDNVLES